MQSILKYLSLPIIIFSFISCEPGNTVKIDYFTPTGEVEKLTNFVVEFSEDLAPADVCLFCDVARGALVQLEHR